MKISRILTAGLTLVVAVVLAGCDLPRDFMEYFNRDGASQGTLQLTIEPADDIPMGIDSYEITGDGPDDASFTVTAETTEVRIEGLARGIWEITVTAKDAEGAAVGMGVEEVEIQAEQETADGTFIIYGNVTLYVLWEGEYAIGDTGPAGGTIFFDKGVYDRRSVSYVEGSNDQYTIDGGSDVGFLWRYMEAAPYGWYNEGVDPGIHWGGDGILVGGTSQSIGTGKENTQTIIAFWEEWKQQRIDNPTHSDSYSSGYDYSDSAVQTHLTEGRIPLWVYLPKNPLEWTWLDQYAAKACVEYSVTVDGVKYDDWFLPAYDTLQPIWWNLISDQSSSNSGRGAQRPDILGGFSTVWFLTWSSSEYTADGGWSQDFKDGTRFSSGHGKDHHSHVRPVRAF